MSAGERFRGAFLAVVDLVCSECGDDITTEGHAVCLDCLEAGERRTAIDLFCGIGGASAGLRAAGFDVVGYERDAKAAEAHEANGHRTVVCDLMDHDWVGTATPDLLWGSPPCQPFSLGGKKLGLADLRDAIPAFVRAVAELRPPVAIMENVRNIMSAKNEPYRLAFEDAVRDLGYVVESRVLDAADYGVPQHRRRYIMLAVRADVGSPVWPEPTHGNPGTLLAAFVTMAEALRWPEDWRHRHEGEMEAAMADRLPIVAGEPVPKWSPLVYPSQPWCWERPAPTIAGRLLAPAPGANANATNGSRKSRNDGVEITVADALALFGFDPSTATVGRERDCILQVGNAVPPGLAEVLAAAQPRAQMLDTVWCDSPDVSASSRSDAPSDLADRIASSRRVVHSRTLEAAAATGSEVFDLPAMADLLDVIHQAGVDHGNSRAAESAGEIPDLAGASQLGEDRPDLIVGDQASFDFGQASEGGVHVHGVKVVDAPSPVNDVDAVGGEAS